MRTSSPLLADSFIDGFAPSDCEAFRGRSARATRRFYAMIDGIGRFLHVEVECGQWVPAAAMNPAS